LITVMTKNVKLVTQNVTNVIPMIAVPCVKVHIETPRIFVSVKKNIRKQGKIVNSFLVKIKIIDMKIGVSNVIGY